MKIDDTLYVGNLIELYGDLLTDKQYNIMSDYYFNNLSLSEISDNYNITRQAVNFTLKQAIALLEKYESKLHIFQKHNYIECELNKIIDSDIDTNTKSKLSKILDTIRS